MAPRDHISVGGPHLRFSCASGLLNIASPITCDFSAFGSNRYTSPQSPSATLLKRVMLLPYLMRMLSGLISISDLALEQHSTKREFMMTDQYVQNPSREAQQALQVQYEPRLSLLSFRAFSDCIRPIDYHLGTLIPTRRDLQSHRSFDENMYDYAQAREFRVRCSRDGAALA